MATFEQVVSTKLKDLGDEIRRLNAWLGTPRREILTAARTYYVNPSTGSDSYDGLSATVSGNNGPFATIQRAVNVIEFTLDLNNQNVTIQLADGTYTLTASVDLRNYITASGVATILGNTSTPSNVVISQSTSGASAFNVSENSRVWVIRGMRLNGTGGTGTAILNQRGRLNFNAIEFNTNWAIHVYAINQSYVGMTGSYSVIAGATYHWLSDEQSQIYTTTAITITLTGTPGFTVFAFASNISEINLSGVTFSGGATVGTQRYQVERNSVIDTNGGGAAFIPGGTGGTNPTGGQYV